MYPTTIFNRTTEYLIFSYFASKTNKLIISSEIKKRTGWKTIYHSETELYNWFIKQYGKSLDLNKEEGQLLRTMEPEYYFKFLEYLKYQS